MSFVGFVSQLIPQYYLPMPCVEKHDGLHDGRPVHVQSLYTMENRNCQWRSTCANWKSEARCPFSIHGLAVPFPISIYALTLYRIHLRCFVLLWSRTKLAVPFISSTPTNPHRLTPTSPTAPNSDGPSHSSSPTTPHYPPIEEQTATCRQEALNPKKV